MDETRGSWPALRTRVRKRPASVVARRPKTKVGACREAGGEKLHRRVAQPPHGRQCEGPTPLLLSLARTLSATIDRRREAVVTLADPKTLRRKESKRAARLLYVVPTTQKETNLRGPFRIVGTRWWVRGCCLGSAKGWFELDEHKVRKWGAWHQHVTLSLLTYALAGGVRSREGQRRDRKTSCYSRAYQRRAGCCAGWYRFDHRMKKRSFPSLGGIGDTQCRPSVATDVEPSVRANRGCVILRYVANVWYIRRIAHCNVLNAASRATWE